MITTSIFVARPIKKRIIPWRDFLVFAAGFMMATALFLMASNQVVPGIQPVAADTSYLVEVESDSLSPDYWPPNDDRQYQIVLKSGDSRIDCTYYYEGKTMLKDPLDQPLRTGTCTVPYHQPPDVSVGLDAFSTISNDILPVKWNCDNIDDYTMLNRSQIFFDLNEIVNTNNPADCRWEFQYKFGFELEPVLDGDNTVSVAQGQTVQIPFTLDIYEGSQAVNRFGSHRSVAFFSAVNPSMAGASFQFNEDSCEQSCNGVLTITTSPMTGVGTYHLDVEARYRPRLVGFDADSSFDFFDRLPFTINVVPANLPATPMGGGPTPPPHP